MADDICIQVKFSVHDDETGLDFTDALYYPLSEWESLDPAVLEAAKQERFNSWKQSITNVPAPAPVVADPVQNALDAVAQAQQALNEAQQALADQQNVTQPPDIPAQ